MATVADLEARITSQDAEIATLKEAIAEQDDAIDNLQTQLDGSGLAELRKLLPGLHKVLDNVYGENVRPAALRENSEEDEEEVTNK